MHLAMSALSMARLVLKFSHDASHYMKQQQMQKSSELYFSNGDLKNVSIVWDLKTKKILKKKYLLRYEFA